MKYESKEANGLRDKSFEHTLMVVKLENDLSRQHDDVEKEQHTETIMSIRLAAAAWFVDEWLRR